MMNLLKRQFHQGKKAGLEGNQSRQLLNNSTSVRCGNISLISELVNLILGGRLQEARDSFSIVLGR
jgi:hypothetical protein